MSDLIFESKSITTPSNLEQFVETFDPFFDHEHGGTRPRTEKINLLVAHWSASEASAEAFHRNIEQRHTHDGLGLSAHAYLDYEGVLWQMADLGVVTRHASSFNGRSIGVEIQNRGLPYTDETIEKSMDAHYPRGRFVVDVHGVSMTSLGFSPAQLDTWSLFAEMVCDFFGIPKIVPGAAGVVSPNLVPVDFAGVCCHYHLDNEKIDAGPLPLEALLDDGFETQI